MTLSLCYYIGSVIFGETFVLKTELTPADLKLSAAVQKWQHATVSRVSNVVGDFRLYN